ncbi:MAG: type II toxin-antitoxin system HicB family antitoxin [Dehalococcoidia bacterium]|nr:type II toxin-antitoxin system HicB family antitoxin [Dehalococcoidia bacterium]
MKSYTFRVELERDDEGWRACFPAGEELRASTWGETWEDALKNIQEVLSIIVEEFAQEGRQIPQTTRITVSEGVLVTVAV